MKNRFKLIGLLIIVISTIAVVFLNSPFQRTTRALEDKLANALESSGTVENLFEFDYDTLYVFEPYQSKAKMEETIGFKTRVLQETVSEGMMNLLFVKDEEPIAYLYGYPSNNHFNIDLLPGTYLKSKLISFTYEVEEAAVGNSSGVESTYLNYRLNP